MRRAYETVGLHTFVACFLFFLFTNDSGILRALDFPQIGLIVLGGPGEVKTSHLGGC